MWKVLQGAMLAALIGTMLATLVPQPAGASPVPIRAVTPREARSPRRRRRTGSAADHSIVGAKITFITPPPAPQVSCQTTQTISVFNLPSVDPGELSRVESAVMAQSMQLRALWGTPCVQFGPGGWSLAVALPALTAGTPSDVGGYHSETADGQPYAVVIAVGEWSYSFSHEVMEMLVDPSGQGREEVCDPTQGARYQIGGVWVSDFVTPAWFGSRRGRLDYMDALQRNGTFTDPPASFGTRWLL